MSKVIDFENRKQQRDLDYIVDELQEIGLDYELAKENAGKTLQIEILPWEIDSIVRCINSRLDFFGEVADTEPADKKADLTKFVTFLEKLKRSIVESTGQPILFNFNFAEIHYFMSALEIELDILNTIFDENPDSVDEVDEDYFANLDEIFDRYSDEYATWIGDLFPEGECSCPGCVDFDDNDFLPLAQITVKNIKPKNLGTVISVEFTTISGLDDFIRNRLDELQKQLIQLLSKDLLVWHIKENPEIFSYVYLPEEEDIFFFSPYGYFIHEIPQLRDLVDEIRGRLQEWYFED